MPKTLHQCLWTVHDDAICFIVELTRLFEICLAFWTIYFPQKVHVLESQHQRKSLLLPLSRWVQIYILVLKEGMYWFTSLFVRSSVTHFFVPFLARLAFSPCELLPSLFVRPSTFHILIFSSETTGPIATKRWPPQPNLI